MQDDKTVWGTLQLPGGGSPALTAAPPRDTHSSVVLLPGIHGRTPHVLSVCQRLASVGLRTVVADAYCDAARRGAIRSPADIAPAVAALDDAAIAAEVVELVGQLSAGSDVAVVGYCIGGTIALRAAQTSAAVATVAYYGVLRHRGPLAEKGPDPLDSLRGAAGPVLAHYGTADPWVPLSDVDDLERALLDWGGPHCLYRYPGAGHAFEEPGSKGFRPTAAQEAAARTTTFLRHYLGDQAG